MQTRFLFDLDGTITKNEALPLIANHFGINADIEQLTQETIKGNIPFVESFIKRVHILSKLPAIEVAELLEKIPLHEMVHNFISGHFLQCAIVTGNLNCWIDKLVAKVGCEYHCSHAEIYSSSSTKLAKILNKECIVKQYQDNGERVVFIGDGNNDADAMRLADISIASGLTHEPANSVKAIADYLVYSEEALCRLLNQLC